MSCSDSLPWYVVVLHVERKGAANSDVEVRKAQRLMVAWENVPECPEGVK